MYEYKDISNRFVNQCKPKPLELKILSLDNNNCMYYIL